MKPEPKTTAGHTPTPYQRYHELQSEMKRLIREGKHAWQIFQDAWEESEAIKNQNNGLPPLPDDCSEYDAQEMELAEQANMKGLR